MPDTAENRASPTSALSSPDVSTPSITVTADDGRAGSVGSLPAPLVEPHKSLTFDIPMEDRGTTGLGATRPKQPEGAKSSDGTLSPTNLARDPELPSPTETPERSRDPTPRTSTGASKKPGGKQSGSLRLLTDLKKTLSSDSLPNSASRDKSPSSFLSAGVVTGNGKFGKMSDKNRPSTPEVRELFQRGRLCPDLDAVNRALESLKAASEDDPYVSHLTRLAEQLQAARTDSRKALTDAMKERDRGNPEICRGLCLSIVQAEHSEVDTKVYAYNILSTQASPGQSLRYLASAWNLVKQHEGKRPDCAKLLATIAMLKENAVVRDRKAPVSETNGDVTNEDDGHAMERPPTMPRECCRPATVRDLLMVPVSKENMPVGDGGAGGSGALTPRTAKILDWAGVRTD